MRQIHLLLFVFLSFGENAFSQQGKCNGCIEWNESRKLKWTDFRGRPKKTSGNEALTDSGMSISLSCKGDVTTVEIESFFNPKSSWTKDHSSEQLLAHEQLHFDITELFVRKLRKQLAVFGSDCKRLNEQIEDYYNKNYKALVAYQSAYDRESNHSINKKEQLRWQKKVAQELDVLDKYASN